jgi:anti-sigma regulatory factor (Ser/Thr protein kinase)
MSQGHPRTPVRTGSAPCVQEPAPTGLPDPAWLGELPSAAAATGFQVASCPLDRGVTASGTARDFTRQILGSWGLRELAEDAVVIVSELVTNALRHGARDRNGSVRDGSGHERVELILLRRPGQMVCAVTDRGAEPPVLARPDPSAEAGRGLCVVEALAATWGWTRLGTHKKAVWATLTVPVRDGGNGHHAPLSRGAAGWALRPAGRSARCRGWRRRAPRRCAPSASGFRGPRAPRRSAWRSPDCPSRACPPWWPRRFPP